MNWLQLAQQLHRELGRSGAGPTAYVGASVGHLRLFDAIADAWLDLQSDPVDWKWMRESLDAPINIIDTEYTGASLGATNFGRWRKPSDEYTVRAYDPLNPTSVWRLKWLPYDRFARQLIDIPPAAASVQYWSITPKEKLIVSPVADIVYNVKADYDTEPIPFVDETDQPNMPTKFHKILVWKGMLQMGKYDAAPEALSRASDKFDELDSSLRLDQGQEITINARPL